MRVKEKEFKQTEIGMIPEDWNIKTLIEDSTLKARIGWQGLTTAEYLDYGDYYLVTGTDFSNDKIQWETCHFVTKERFEQDKNIQLKTLDILITKDGTIGKVAFIDFLILESTLNSGVFVVRPKNDAYNPKYLFYIFKSLYFDNFLRQLVAGSTINHLYQKDFVNFKYPLPPTKEEQRVIAEALSDANGYISSLEKLIAKKRLIKQGAMQELLTLKPHWEVKKLGEIGKCLRGVSYNAERDLYPYDTFNTVRLLRSNNVQQQLIDLNELQFVDCSRVKSSQYLLDKDVVICMANGSKQLVGKAAIFKNRDSLKYTFGAFMGAFRVIDKDVNSDFIFFNFLSYNYRSYIDILLSGSSINNLKPSDIESIEIPFPPSEKEQSEIAKILNEIDSEIEALDKRLEKVRQIKQGMMQQLLTGKIRLV